MYICTFAGFFLPKQAALSLKFVYIYIFLTLSEFNFETILDCLNPTEIE